VNRLRKRKVKIPEKLAWELEKMAEAEGLSIRDFIAMLVWKKYVKGDFLKAYLQGWKYLSR